MSWSAIALAILVVLAFSRSRRLRRRRRSDLAVVPGRFAALAREILGGHEKSAQFAASNACASPPPREVDNLWRPPLFDALGEPVASDDWFLNWLDAIGDYDLKRTIAKDLQIEGERISTAFSDGPAERVPGFDMSASSLDASIDGPSVDVDWSLLLGDHSATIDEAMALNDLASATADSLGVADGVAASSDAAFPVLAVLVALARSSHRERKLLSAGDTTAGRAARNIAIDTTSKAVGVWAGAEAGAGLGSAVDFVTLGLPLGPWTLLGTLVGGILGGRKASRLAGKWREGPLRRAQQQMTEALSQANSRVATAEQKLNWEWSVACREIRHRVERQTTASEVHHEISREKIRADYRAAVDGLAQLAVEAMGKTELEAFSSPSPFPPRQRWPGSALDSHADRVCLRRGHATWRRQRRKVLRRDPGDVEAMFDLSMISPVGHASARRYLGEVQRARAKAVQGVESASRLLEENLLRIRAESESSAEKAGIRIDRLADEAKADLASTLERCEQAVDTFRRECRAAGYCDPVRPR